MKKVSIIISTYGSRIINIPFSKAISSVSCMVVHQKSTEIKEDMCLVDDGIKYLPISSIGLSKSRNAGLENCKTKFAYIMDDDVLFDKTEILKVTSVMEEDNVDVATCKFKFDDGSFPKKYSKKSFDHNIFTAAKVSSIEICVNVESLRSRGIRFDENFGLGTDLPSGEEYIFIADCISKGLKVRFYPILIGIHPNETSGMDFYTSHEKVLAKREMFKRIFGWRSFIFILAFWMKKLPTVLKEGYLISFTKTLILGVK